MAAAPQGYTGQMELGGATFSLAIDTSSLDRGLRAAETSAQRASQRIGQALGKGGSAAMGLQMLGQTLDDLQYGFRSVVNNIPQIVAAFGGGAGLAGGVGIAAVALNQVISHLDELKATAEMSPQLQQLISQIEDLAKAVDDVSKAATGQGFQDLLAGLLGGGKIGKAMEALGLGGAARAAGAADARMQAAGLKAQEEVGKVTSSEKQERAKLFRDALESYGGGEKLIQDYAARLMNRFPGMDQGRANGMSAQAIQQALQGGAFAGGMFGNAFEAVYDRIAREAETKILNKLGEENEKNTPGLHADVGKALTAEGAANEQRLRAQLDAERDQLQKQARALQEQIASMKPAQQFGSMRDYLSSVSVSGADAVRKQQLDKLKGIEKGVEKLNDQIKAIGQARFQ